MLSFHTEEELKRWKAAHQVRVRLLRLTAVRYVYTRIFAPYGDSRLLDRYNDLRSWLTKRGTDVRDIVCIGMSLDDPSITPAERCRYDLGVAFPTEPGGILGGIIRSRSGSSRRGARLPDRSECEAQGVTMRDFAPCRSRPFNASAILRTRNAPGTIYTGSGFRPAASYPRTCRRWNCS
jgi:hypothetical protein